MSVAPQSKRTPKFTSIEEMKRWQSEREDRLHREQVREKMIHSQTTAKPPKSPK